MAKWKESHVLTKTKIVYMYQQRKPRVVRHRYAILCIHFLVPGILNQRTNGLVKAHLISGPSVCTKHKNLIKND